MKDVLLFEIVGMQRYRERQGPSYNDFEVGDIIEHRPGRTVTEADNVWQSLINHNAHPLHIDKCYAEATEFGRCVVSSLVTLSIIGGLSTSGTSVRAIANLGWERIRLLSPVFVGDTLYSETEIKSKRQSNSRKNCGIICFHTKGLQQEGRVVMEFTRSALFNIGE